MSRDRFGPNTAAVEAFLNRLSRLTRAEWERVVETAPGIGALPDLEVSMAPEYFMAFDAASKAAKRSVFPGSETAFWDAMRTAQLRAGDNAFKRAQQKTDETSGGSTQSERISPEAEAERLSRLALEGYEDEAWRRATNAAMVAAGALVLKRWLRIQDFDLLFGPLAAASRQ